MFVKLLLGLLLLRLLVLSESLEDKCDPLPDTCPSLHYLDWSQLLRSPQSVQERSSSHCKKDPYHVFSLLTFLTSLVVLVVTIAINNNLNNNNNKYENAKVSLCLCETV